MGQARSIAVHVKAIRGKLGECAKLVETVHGVGYRFREPDSSKAHIVLTQDK
jgi:DNA-binding response OmpR family regulator